MIRATYLCVRERSINLIINWLDLFNILQDLEYDDGAPPPDVVIEKWFQLITDVCQQGPGSCIAVHCKAGLGRLELENIMIIYFCY